MVCLFQTHRRIWYKQICLPQTLTYSEALLYTDLVCLRQTLTLTVFTCADFQRHLRTEGTHTERCVLLTHPTAHDCQPRVTVLSVVKCKRKHQLLHTDAMTCSHATTHEPGPHTHTCPGSSQTALRPAPTVWIKPPRPILHTHATHTHTPSMFFL